MPGRSAASRASSAASVMALAIFRQMDLVLRLDFLRAHQHALIAVGELRFGKHFADGRLHVQIPDVDADALARERADQPFDLLGPAFHPNFSRKFARGRIWSGRARACAVRQCSKSMVQRIGIVIARQHRDGVAHDECGAEMMAIARQVARIFGAENKQRIQIGIIQRILGALQAFPQHPLRIEARFPIDWNDSNVRHSVFLPENNRTPPLALLLERVKFEAFEWHMLQPVWL